ncbi:MAG: hypothetical protein ACON35_05750 [Candidatus Marinamargulisbacteria bacterium]
MIKKRLILICSFFILVTQFGLQAIEISSLKPPCCCKTQCECDHSPEKTPILRNVRCGDNSDAQIIGHCLDILDTIKPIRSLKEAPQNIIQLSLNLNNRQNNIEPPPPKTILS